ncbi:UNVERIFIED_CONTAM: hypothetical protein FKN15_046549 [Acipenser sinensis]
MIEKNDVVTYRKKQQKVYFIFTDCIQGNKTGELKHNEQAAKLGPVKNRPALKHPAHPSRHSDDSGDTYYKVTDTFKATADSNAACSLHARGTAVVFITARGHLFGQLNTADYCKSNKDF